MSMAATLLCGDVREQLRTLESDSIQCVVTSPPYWGLRDYGVNGQLGLEPTPAEYVTTMVDVFREIRRVLRPDGTVFLNLGDSYSAGGRGGGADNAKQQTNVGSLGFEPWRVEGYAPKQLLGTPWRVAFALQEDGWWLRSDIIWAKPNPMPESVTDRPTRSHEYVFLLTKQARYFYDATAIAEPAAWERWGDQTVIKEQQGTASWISNSNKDTLQERTTRNKRTVWTIPTQPYPQSHFATFPEKLVEPCILAGSRPGDTILDPFAGSGTVGVVSLRHGRSFVGIDLNPEYIEMARKRIKRDCPLFNIVEAAG